MQLQQPLLQNPSVQQLVVQELWQEQAQALSFGSSISWDHSRVSPGAQRLPRRLHAARTTAEGQRQLLATPNPPRGAKLPRQTAAGAELGNAPKTATGIGLDPRAKGVNHFSSPLLHQLHWESLFWEAVSV